jgi:hypothetical protein
VLVGVVIPVAAMEVAIGRENLLDAPAHGSVLLLLTMPIGAVVSLVPLFGFTSFFCEKFSRQ